MIEVADLLISTARESISYFWFPLVLWTVFAAAISIILHFWGDSIPATYQLHSRSALLITLPFSIIGSALVSLWTALAGSVIPEVAKFIVITSPVTVTATVKSNAAVTWADPFLWIGIALVLLALGSLIAAFYLVWNLISLRRISSTLDFSPVESVLGEESTSRHSLIAFSDEIEIPFTYGGFKNRIILPKSLQDQEQKLRLAVKHELIHIRHHDFWVNNVLSFIKCLFWFHPLTHFLHKHCKAYREIICDSEVLSDSTVSKKGYAMLLFEFSTKQLSGSHAAISMAVSPSTLKKRIKMMNKQPNKSYKKSLLLMSLSALLVIGVISCSDMQQNGITNQELKQVQSEMAQQEPTANRPLYIVNGERFDSPDAQNVLSRIKTKYIKNITILKGEKAVAEYGQAGANGVVEIALNAKEKALNDLMEKPPAPLPAPTGHSVITIPQADNPIAPFFVAVEDMPDLIGGLASIQKKIDYPETARRAGIEGTVIIQFIVNKQGEVENAQVIRGIGGGTDKEALRVVKQAKFKPGQQNGQPVRVQYSMPITFKLPDKK